jgi:hypothetical protein
MKTIAAALAGTVAGLLLLSLFTATPVWQFAAVAIMNWLDYRLKDIAAGLFILLMAAMVARPVAEGIAEFARMLRTGRQHPQRSAGQVQGATIADLANRAHEVQTGQPRHSLELRPFEETRALSVVARRPVA